eukprot:GHVU01209776.1.p1 GENE.GHVU01209776.1~~GHVU01209776.1.p1  ORF type:complete len:239 (+),score=22.41 GHVU01209776.1:21-737(+)
MGNWFGTKTDTQTLRSFEELAALLRESKYAIALTGAGMSAESGIPTFRNPSDGLWKKYDPMTYATIWGFKSHPEKIWELLRDFVSNYDPQPNAGHRALAELQKRGYVKSVITQNVDHLHEDAGSADVINFHGTLMSAKCRKCHRAKQLSKAMLADAAFMSKLPPSCESCGGIMKPDAVLFGESIPSGAVRDADREINKCDLLLVIGTSATVTPASNLPRAALRRGAKVVEVLCWLLHE